MQISSSLGSTATRLLQAEMAKLLSGMTATAAAGSADTAVATAASADATVPTSATGSAAPAANAPKSQTPSDQFSASLLSSLLSAQQQTAPPADTLAGRMMASLDTDGDGALSLSEAGQALGTLGADQDTSPTSKAGKAFAAVDSNSDGEISTSELASALQKYAQAKTHGHHHHHGAEAPAGNTQVSAQTAAQSAAAPSDPTTGGSVSTVA